MSRTLGSVVAAGAILAAIAPVAEAGSVFSSGATAPSIVRATTAAVPGTAYGGSANTRTQIASPSLGLVVQADGHVVARASLGYGGCRKTTFTPVFVRLKGAVQGNSFSAAGSTRLTKRRRMRMTLQGTFDGQAATGTVRLRVRGCRGATRSFALRTESAPGGPPAMPAPRAVMHGLTGQSAGGVRLPISLAVTHNGKVWAMWDAAVDCGRGTVPIANLTPVTKIRPDGTFTRSERYSIRYSDGSVDHYRVRLSGAFRADGASGTLRASVRHTRRGERFRTCASGTQTWAARG